MLKLDTAPPDELHLPHLAASKINADLLIGNKVRFFGFPAGVPLGVWGDAEVKGVQTTGLLQLEDERGRGYEVQRGFSGTPIWDAQTWEILGMIIGSDPKHEETRVGYAIPSNTIAAFCGLKPNAPMLTNLSSSSDHHKVQDLLKIAFLCLFTDGILKSAFDYLVSQKGYYLSLEQLKNTEEYVIKYRQNGTSFVKLNPEYLSYLRGTFSNVATVVSRTFDILLDFCGSSDVFLFDIDVGIGRSLLLRDLCRLAIRLDMSLAATRSKREKASFLARQFLPRILEEGNTKVALEIVELLRGLLSFDPKDYILHANILLHAEKPCEAFELLGLYIGDGFFEDCGLSNNQRISAIITWAKAAKDSGHAGKIHDRLLSGYDKAIQLLPKLLDEGIDNTLIKLQRADLLNNRATQLAIFGSRILEWQHAKADMREAMRVYLAERDFLGYVFSVANLVALSLERASNSSRIDILDKMMSKAEGYLRGSKKDRRIFFFYYQWGRLVRRRGPANQTRAKALFQTARNIAQDLGANDLDAIATQQILRIQHEMEGMPYLDYVSGLNQCIVVLEGNLNPAWVANTLIELFLAIASTYQNKGEHRLAWEASLGAFRVLHHRAHISGIAISAHKASRILELMKKITVDETTRDQFTAQYRECLNILMGCPMPQQEVKWHNLSVWLEKRS